MLEFDVGVLGRELPVTFGMLGIAVSLPCGELVQEDLLVGDAAVETLRRENGEFGFRHIEPTAVLWRVSMPLCANFCRTRPQIIGYVPKASEICGSPHLGPNGLSSAHNSALSCFLAGPLPFRISFSSHFRSSALCSTT